MTAAAIAVGAMLQALVGAWLIRRLAAFPVTLERVNEICVFLVAGGPVSCLISATVGVGSLFAFGAVPASQAGFGPGTKCRPAL